MANMTLPLKDLFRLAFTEPVTWLSQTGPSNKVVRWIVLSMEEAQPDDLLLVPAADLNAEVLRRAGERNLAVVLILGDQAHAGVPIPEGLAVAAVTGHQDIRDVQRTLLTLLINHRSVLVERSLLIHTRLSQLALEGSGLLGLAQAMADIAGEGILIQDKRLNVLADCPSSPLLAIWPDVVAQLSAGDSLPDPFFNRKLAGRQVLPVRQGIPGGLERLIIPITVNEVARGFLSVVGVAGKLDILDQLVVEQGASVCAVEMARNKAVREAEKRLIGDMITALLQEDISSTDARLWAHAMGVDLDQIHVALRFAWAGSGALSRRRLETLINGEISRQGLRVVVSPMGPEVICFYLVSRSSGRPEEAVAFAQAVLNQGKQEYPDTPIRCGVGTPVRELSAWRVSFRQAGQALEMARRFGEGKPLFFPDLSVYRLLLQIENNPELVAFQEEMLGALLAYENGRELIHTLEIYFKHNGNLAQAAETLFIHRNTLNYRMERIAAITGLDLNNPNTRLAMQLALHIDRMMGNTEK